MKRREQISAWIMLLVFVPTLLLSYFHIHDVPSTPIDCDECAEHVHHVGHIEQFSPNVDDCALCRFTSQRFVPALQSQELKVDAIVVAVVVEPVPEDVVDMHYGVSSLRAPPAIL